MKRMHLLALRENAPSCSSSSRNSVCRCKPADARLLTKRLARCGLHPLLRTGRQQDVQQQEAPPVSAAHTGPHASTLSQLQQRQDPPAPDTVPQPWSMPPMSAPTPCRGSSSSCPRPAAAAAAPSAAGSFQVKAAEASAATPQKRPAPVPGIAAPAPQKRPALHTRHRSRAPVGIMQTDPALPPCKVLRYNWERERR